MDNDNKKDSLLEELDFEELEKLILKTTMETMDISLSEEILKIREEDTKEVTKKVRSR